MYEYECMSMNATECVIKLHADNTGFNRLTYFVD